MISIIWQIITSVDRCYRWRNSKIWFLLQYSEKPSFQKPPYIYQYSHFQQTQFPRALNWFSSYAYKATHGSPCLHANKTLPIEKEKQNFNSHAQREDRIVRNIWTSLKISEITVLFVQKAQFLSPNLGSSSLMAERKLILLIF